MRSQSVPKESLFGYVAPDDLYHAWNMFYTEENGWSSVEFSVNSDDWSRIGLAFYANGADDKSIGDGWKSFPCSFPVQARLRHTPKLRYTPISTIRMRSRDFPVFRYPYSRYCRESHAARPR